MQLDDLYAKQALAIAAAKAKKAAAKSIATSTLPASIFSPQATLAHDAQLAPPVLLKPSASVIDAHIAATVGPLDTFAACEIGGACARQAFDLPAGVTPTVDVMAGAANAAPAQIVGDLHAKDYFKLGAMLVGVWLIARLLRK